MNTKIKYYTFLILALVLILTSCDNLAKNADNTTSSTIKSGYIDISFVKDIERAQIAVAKNGDLYLTDEYRIYILDSEGNEKKQIVNDKQRHYKILTSYDGGFFASGYGNELEEYNTDNTLIKKHKLVGVQNIEKMLYIDGKLFFKYHIGDNEGDKYLAEYNLVDGKFNKIDIGKIRDVVEYSENMLLVLLDQDCCNGHMLIYNINNGEKSDEIHIEKMPSSFYLHYNSGKDCLYLISQGNIYVASLKEKKIIETYTSSIIPKIYTAFYRNNISYYIDKEQKRIISFNLDDISNSKSITVLCNSFASESYFRSLAYEFGTENNNTVV